MSPVTHLLVSWSAASTMCNGRKYRALATVAGIAPDLDGIGLLWDMVSYQPGQPLTLWSRFHHVLGHNVTFGLTLAVMACLLATRRTMTFVAVSIVFHLHLLCDLLGSRGPDEIWSIPYLLPFSRSWNFAWANQWPLNSWQNVAITVAAMVCVFYQGWKYEISPLELLSQRANDSFVGALRARFGTPANNRY